MFEKFWETFKKKEEPEEEIQFKTVEPVEQAPAITTTEDTAPVVEETPAPIIVLGSAPRPATYSKLSPRVCAATITSEETVSLK